MKSKLRRHLGADVGDPRGAAVASRMLRLQVSPAGQSAPRWNSMPYSWSLPGIVYGPNAVSSTP